MSDGGSFEASLVKGMLLFVPEVGQSGGLRGLEFQYNPETVTRNRAGEWSTDRNRAGQKFLTPQDQRLLDGHRGGGLFAKSETIAFKIVLDASNELARSDELLELGVLPQLGVLEQIALGGEELPSRVKKPKPPKKKADDGKTPGTGKDKPPTADPKKPTDSTDAKAKARAKIVPTAPSEVLLVLGPRVFPVVVTSMNIVERRFTPGLVPVRAEVDLQMRILQAGEVRHNRTAEQAFAKLAADRTRWSESAVIEAEAQIVALDAAIRGGG